MATKVYTATVHAIGEDNESNFCLVARTREALERKLEEALSFEDENPEWSVVVSLQDEDFYNNYSVQWDEQELED